MRMRFSLLLLLGCAACGSLPPRAPPSHLAVAPQIVTTDRDTTEPELFKQAERELLEGQYADARRDFELLLKSDPSEALLPKILFDLGTADEALGDRQAAQGAYHLLATKFPGLSTAHTALVRCVALHAVLEQWPELRDTGEAILARTDIDNLDKLSGLGARGLANAELGDTKLAMRDIQAGIDTMDDVGISRAQHLPSAGALLNLALGEAKRIDSERIALQPVTDEFVMKLSMRCQGVLDAQAGYAQAMRTNDLQWGMMAGYRLASMYESLHRELMSIPPDGFAKSDYQRQLFYGAMHIRYRALLEKALIMLNTTLDAADLVSSHGIAVLPTWVQRGRDEKVRMEKDLAEEKATLAKLPVTEETIDGALQLLQQKYEKTHKTAAK